MKKTLNPMSILVYVAIIIFVLVYDKLSSGNTTVDSIVAFAVAAVVFVVFGLVKVLKNRKK